MQEAEEMRHLGVMTGEEYTRVERDALTALLGPAKLTEVAELIRNGGLPDEAACRAFGTLLAGEVVGPVPDEITGSSVEDALRDPRVWFASFLSGWLEKQAERA